ncbi:MAG: FkbM family methyltransferase [Acidimicrobiales bacterium]
MIRLLHAGHRLIIWVIRHSPILSSFLFRAYNKVLTRLRDDYTGRTYFGSTLNCSLVDSVQRHIFHFGHWEPNNSALLSSILRPGDVFVDLGANIGYYTLLASSRVGEGGSVIAVEALPQIFELLKKNVVANGLRNVRLVNVAVAGEAGELPIYGAGPENRGMSSSVPHDDWPIEAVVPAAPLDEILTPEERARVKVIKIDIEGGELVVLERLVETLGLYPHDVQLLVELAPYITGEPLVVTFDKLLASGFDAYEIENSYDLEWYLKWRHPSPPRRVDRLPVHQGDVLFSRSPSGPVV